MYKYGRRRGHDSQWGGRVGGWVGKWAGGWAGGGDGGRGIELLCAVFSLALLCLVFRASPAVSIDRKKDQRRFGHDTLRRIVFQGSAILRTMGRRARNNLHRSRPSRSPIHPIKRRHGVD